MTTVRVPEAGWTAFKERTEGSVLSQIVGAVPDEATDERVVTFDPPLTAPQLAKVEDWIRATELGLSDTDWATLKPLISGLKVYEDIASPTQAQVVQATKSIIGVLKVLVKD